MWHPSEALKRYHPSALRGRSECLHEFSLTIQTSVGTSRRKTGGFLVSLQRDLNSRPTALLKGLYKAAALPLSYAGFTYV